MGDLARQGSRTLELALLAAQEDAEEGVPPEPEPEPAAKKQPKRPPVVSRVISVAAAQAQGVGQKLKTSSSSDDRTGPIIALVTTTEHNMFAEAEKEIYSGNLSRCSTAPNAREPGRQASLTNLRGPSKVVRVDCLRIELFVSLQTPRKTPTLKKCLKWLARWTNLDFWTSYSTRNPPATRLCL